MSHYRTVRSSLPVARVLPSGLNATERTRKVSDHCDRYLQLRKHQNPRAVSNGGSGG